MRIWSSLVAVAVLLATAPAEAPAQSVGRMLVDDFKHAGGDIWAVITSPVDASGKDWLLAGATLGAAAAVSPFDDDIDRWAVRNRNSRFFALLGPVRRGGVAYGGNRLVPVAGAVLIGGYIAKDQKIRDGVFGCAASYAANSQIRHQVFYRFVNRTRPAPGKDVALTAPPAQHGDQYDIGFSLGDSSWSNNSFPGGHVANIMTCATLLNERFDMGLVEPLLYGFAAAVGIGRIADRGHWMSDQVVGVVFAYAIGREVALRQRKRVERSREAGIVEPVALPRPHREGFYLIRDDTRGIGLGWQRRL